LNAPCIVLNGGMMDELKRIWKKVGHGLLTNYLGIFLE
jgi:hypothetical protein